MDESGGTLIVTRHLRRHDERGIPEHPTRLPKTALRTVFGERGVVELIGISGYYTMVSMTLNVAGVELPEGEKGLEP